MRWILIAVSLFGALDAALLWSERPSRSERAWQRYWKAQAVAAPAPRPSPPTLEEPLLPAAPAPTLLGGRAPALDRWLREKLGDDWPSSLVTDLVGAVEIDLSGLSVEARTGALLLGRFLPADSGVSILQDGQRLRITLSGDTGDA